MLLATHKTASASICTSCHPGPSGVTSTRRVAARGQQQCTVQRPPQPQTHARWSCSQQHSNTPACHGRVGQYTGQGVLGRTATTVTRASSSSAVPEDSSNQAAAVPAPARQQATAYIALALLFTALAAATTLAPGWSLQHTCGFPATVATSLQLVNAGAYLWLVASCLLCLKDAALHERLQSDTYQRLNLGLMYQSVVVLLLLLRHKSLLSLHVLGCSATVFVATALVAGRAYAASVGGLSVPKVVRSLLSNLRDLLQPKGLISAFYALSAALALLQFLWHYPSAATPLFMTDLGPVALLLKQARGAGMVLAGVVWYTLKDAADRGRLAATTFRQLNLAMAVLAALQLWGLWRMADLGVPLNMQLWRALVAGAVAVLVVCDSQYFFARKKA